MAVLEDVVFPESRVNQDSHTAPRKKGLLIVPEFPDDSFWGYHHIVRWTGKRTVFPPLGLLTFAAYMPTSWDFELMDLNVETPPERVLRRKIAEADVVFTGAMSIQKPSLVQLLSGPAKGLDTPWVLGGPYPSSYRDQILNPQTASDRVLFDGLDLLVWGEAYNWISTINALLEAQPGHQSGRPALLIPEAVAGAPPGSRNYLVDRSLFAPLADVASPRWDLIDVQDYRSSMVQTTAGCPFRCDFCDIVQFNGGFSRPKTPEGVRRDLEAIYATGYRGGVFTVDDNFVGDPRSIDGIIDVMTEFQRAHGYPFSFFTQASVNIGTPKLKHLIGKMKRAGFTAVFLGIENPDENALKRMNKKQNNMVDLEATVREIQETGLEVFGGFILGGDEDTPATAQQIATFIKTTAIHSAMAGLLTPVPHTPLYERLKGEGRIIPTEFSGNNTDDDIQFRPANMTVDQLRGGIHDLLLSLFSSAEVHRRARDVLERVTPHVFTNPTHEFGHLKAVLLSVWQQGVVRGDSEYFRLLKHAIMLDYQQYRRAKKEHGETVFAQAAYAYQDPVVLLPNDLPRARALLERAQDYFVRYVPHLSLQHVADFVGKMRERLHEGVLPAGDFRRLYDAAGNLLTEQMRRHRFPGVYLANAFELAIKGAHYEQVARSIVSRTSPC